MCIRDSMTTYYGPGAAGSGVAEMIGYLNGVNYPGFIGINTLITKIFGVVFAVSSRLCIGKEGPLCHIGSIIGAATPYCYFRLDFLRNDFNKRALVAAGGSAGVAAAFGAPIGGALFAFEMSNQSAFWSFRLLWRTFITCAFAVATLGFFQVFTEADPAEGFKGSATKFGKAFVEHVSAI